MKRVIIESPYAGNVKENIEYAKLCMKDSLSRGEAPIASHLLYTQEGLLDDNIPQEREQGIKAGLAWCEVAEVHAFYIDHGFSAGMIKAWRQASNSGVFIDLRKILK